MSDPSNRRVRVWDLPTRIFHWLLVLLIFCSWASFEYSEVFGDTSLLWHRMNGYAILILVIWRLLWGIVGSPASRFVSFLVWPWTAARYGFDLVTGRSRHFLGHNPLGSYMIIALLGIVSAQGIIGLLATEHNFVTWGPLTHLVSDERSEELAGTHVWLFHNVILAFIALHVAANVLYRLVKKDPLIEAMVTGSKPAGDYEDGAVAMDAAISEVSDTPDTSNPTSRRSILLRAAVCMAAAIAIFAGAILGLGGKLFY